MRDIMFYVARAIERSGSKSERVLCELLNMSHNTITHYRKGALPNDDTMIRLAKIAGIDPAVALLDLNSWRSEGEAQKTYLKMLEKITAAIAIFIAIGAIAVPARAAPALPHNCQMENAIVYITEIKRKISRGFKALALKAFSIPACQVVKYIA